MLNVLQLVDKWGTEYGMKYEYSQAQLQASESLTGDLQLFSFFSDLIYNTNSYTSKWNL